MLRRIVLPQCSSPSVSHRAAPTARSQQQHHHIEHSRSVFQPRLPAPRRCSSTKPECDPKKNYYATGEVKKVILSTGESADVGSAAHIYDQVGQTSIFFAKIEQSKTTIVPSGSATTPKPQPK